MAVGMAYVRKSVKEDRAERGPARGRWAARRDHIRDTDSLVTLAGLRPSS